MKDSSGEILWTTVSRFHHWSNKEFPARIVQSAVAADLIGPVEWLSIQEGPRKVVFIDDLDRLGKELFALAKPHPKHEIITLEAGGSSPTPWNVTVHLPPFVKRDNRVWGYGVVSLVFDRLRAATSDQCAVLLDQFFALNTPDVTEYACIHPFDRLRDLRVKEYKQPLTATPMFGGVYWANFLGVGQLEFFDTSRLRNLAAYRVSWIDERGLFLAVSPNLGDAESPQTEKEMARLTGVFRGALK
jgi:hypothetical protein